MSLAHRFGREGYTVALVSRTDTRHAGYVSALAEAGVKAEAFVADVATATSPWRPPWTPSDRWTCCTTGLVPSTALGHGPSPRPRPTRCGTSWPASTRPSRLSVGCCPACSSGAWAGCCSPVASAPSSRYRCSVPLAVSSAALRNYVLTLNAGLAGTGVYAGTLTIGGLIERGDIHQLVVSQPEMFGGVPPTTLDPDEIAESAWELYEKRDRAEAVFTVLGLITPRRPRSAGSGRSSGRLRTVRGAGADPFDVLEDRAEVRAHGGAGLPEVAVAHRREDLDVLGGEHVGGLLSFRPRRRARSRCPFAETTVVHARSCPASVSRPWWNSSSRAKNSSRSMPGRRCCSRFARRSATQRGVQHRGQVVECGQLDGLAEELGVGDPVRVHAGHERPDLREHLNEALVGQQDQAFPHRCPAHAEGGGQLVLRQRGPGRQLQRQHLAPQRLVHDAAVRASAVSAAWPPSRQPATSTPALDVLPDRCLYTSTDTPELGSWIVSTIERARCFVASPGRNFVTLRITTSDGVTGLGDATLNGRELAVASYLRDHLVPLLIGRDPARIEDMWQYLYRGAYWRRGPVTMTAIAAVDTALWDIKGKVAGPARLPAARRPRPRRRAGLLARQRHRRAVAARRRRPVPRPGLPGDPRAGRACPASAAATGCARARSTSRPPPALPDEQPWSHRGLPGLRARLPATRCASGSASTSTCCTTCTTGSPRSRPPGSARASRTAGCSGWRTRPRRRTRRRSGSSASTPPPRSRSARCSAPSGTSST